MFIEEVEDIIDEVVKVLFIKSTIMSIHAYWVSTLPFLGLVGRGWDRMLAHGTVPHCLGALEHLSAGNSDIKAFRLEQEKSYNQTEDINIYA